MIVEQAERDLVQGRLDRRDLGQHVDAAARPLIDANQAAELLGVPATWLLAQARAGKIPHHRLGRYVRFDIDELIAWVDQNAIHPK